MAQPAAHILLLRRSRSAAATPLFNSILQSWNLHEHSDCRTTTLRSCATPPLGHSSDRLLTSCSLDALDALPTSCLPTPSHILFIDDGREPTTPDSVEDAWKPSMSRTILGGAPLKCLQTERYWKARRTRSSVNLTSYEYMINKRIYLLRVLVPK